MGRGRGGGATHDIRGEGSERGRIIFVFIARGSGEVQTQWHGVIVLGLAPCGYMARCSRDGPALSCWAARCSPLAERKRAAQPRLKVAVESTPGYCGFLNLFVDRGL